MATLMFHNGPEVYLQIVPAQHLENLLWDQSRFICVRRRSTAPAEKSREFVDHLALFIQRSRDEVPPSDGTPPMDGKPFGFHSSMFLCRNSCQHAAKDLSSNRFGTDHPTALVKHLVQLFLKENTKHPKNYSPILMTLFSFHTRAKLILSVRLSSQSNRNKSKQSHVRECTTNTA